MYKFFDLFYLIFANISFLFFILITGFLISSVIKLPVAKPFSRLFIYAITGIFSSVVVFSIYVSKFNTLNSLLILLYAPILLKNISLPDIRNFIILRYLNDLKIILLYSFLLILLILIQCYRLDFFSQKIIRLGQDDYAFYSTVSEGLNKTGVENVYNYFKLYDTYKNVDLKNIPYHYFDIWLVALLSKFYNLNSLIIYLYVFIPFTALTVIIGLTSLISVILKKNVHLLLVLLFAFFFAFYMGILPFKSGGLYVNPIMQPRFFTSYLILILASILLYSKNYQWFYVVLLTLPFFNILALPVVCTICFLFSVYIILNNKTSKTGQIGIVYSFVVPIAIIIYYQLNGGLFYLNNPNTDFSINEYLSNFYLLMFRETLAKFWLFFLPATLCLLLAFRYVGILFKQNKEVYMFLVLLFFFSLFYSWVFSFNNEKGTIMDLALVPAILIFLVIYFCNACNFWNIQGLFVKLNAVIILILSAFSLFTTITTPRNKGTAYGSEFFGKMWAFKELYFSGSGAYILSDAELSRSYFYVQPHILRYGSIFKLLGRQTYATSISMPVNLDSLKYKETRQSIEISPFYKYYINNCKENNNYSIEQAQVDFIAANKIKFCIVHPKNAPVSKLLMNKSFTEFEDEMSNSKVLLFK